MSSESHIRKDLDKEDFTKEVSEEVARMFGQPLGGGELCKNQFERFSLFYSRVADDWRAYLTLVWAIPSATLLVIGSALGFVYASPPPSPVVKVFVLGALALFCLTMYATIKRHLMYHDARSVTLEALDWMLLRRCEFLVKTEHVKRFLARHPKNCYNWEQKVHAHHWATALLFWITVGVFWIFFYELIRSSSSILSYIYGNENCVLIVIAGVATFIVVSFTYDVSEKQIEWFYQNRNLDKKPHNGEKETVDQLSIFEYD